MDSLLIDRAARVNVFDPTQVRANPDLKNSSAPQDSYEPMIVSQTHRYTDTNTARVAVDAYSNRGL